RTANLHSAVAELEAYSYSISHDLRAPLRAMQTYAGILVEDCADRMGSDGREYLQRIMAASERMDRLIRDVLLFSRTARADTTLEPVPLAPLLASVVESYPALNASGGQIDVVEPLATVEANPAALTQCVANLLGNAIKFVAPGVRPRIRVWSVVERSEERRVGEQGRSWP